MVTRTATVPAVVVAGAVTVICVGDTTTGFSPATRPKATVAPVTKPVPVIVTSVPPEVGPVAVSIALTVGCGAT